MIVTVKLHLPNVTSKAQAIIAQGEIAHALHATHDIIDISDDFSPADNAPVVAKVRKPRGPNKPKIMPASDIPSADQPVDVIPGFLKRT